MYLSHNAFVQIAKCICLDWRWVLRSDAPIIWTNCRWNQANPLNLSNPLRPPTSSSYWHLSSFFGGWDMYHHFAASSDPHITLQPVMMKSRHNIVNAPPLEMSCPELVGGLNLSEARQSKWQGHLHARAAVNMKVSVTCRWNWLLRQGLWTFYDCWCESNCCHLILFLDTRCQSYTSLLPTCFLLDL